MKLAKKNIVHIYCGESSSFAVDHEGEIYAWGLNKNNCLLVNRQEHGIVVTLAKEPMLMNLP
jgi:alpha-tubulin suppressor-like RCC1 family protein